MKDISPLIAVADLDYMPLRATNVGKVIVCLCDCNEEKCENVRHALESIIDQGYEVTIQKREQ